MQTGTGFYDSGFQYWWSHNWEDIWNKSSRYLKEQHVTFIYFSFTIIYIKIKIFTRLIIFFPKLPEM